MHPSILKEYQRDPIRGHVRHIDLQEVRLDVAIQATVQVHLQGAEDAPGVKEGGVLSPAVHDAQRRGSADGSPRVDRGRRQLDGDGRRAPARGLPALEGVTFLDDPHETVIATVSAPTVEAEPEPEEGEEGEEGEALEGEAAEGETAEGEAPAGGEAAESGSDAPE